MKSRTGNIGNRKNEAVPAVPLRAGRREWVAFVVLLLPLLLVSMDISVLYFALPAISEELEPSAVRRAHQGRRHVTTDDLLVDSDGGDRDDEWQARRGEHAEPGAVPAVEVPGGQQIDRAPAQDKKEQQEDRYQQQ